LKIKQSITNINNILDLVDFEKRGEYVLADVKSATWFFECIYPEDISPDDFCPDLLGRLLPVATFAEATFAEATFAQTTIARKTYFRSGIYPK
jgi:hypothetical protein